MEGTLCVLTRTHALTYMQSIWKGISELLSVYEAFSHSRNTHTHEHARTYTATALYV